jgi:hypothetical protein
MWTADDGLIFKLKGPEWLGPMTPHIMRQIADYLNMCLEEFDAEQNTVINESMGE